MIIASLILQNTTVKAFLGDQARKIYSIKLQLNSCCGSYTQKPGLVDPNLFVSLEVKGFMGAKYNIRQNKFNITDRFYYNGRHGDVVNNVERLSGNTCTLPHEADQGGQLFSSLCKFL